MKRKASGNIHSMELPNKRAKLDAESEAVFDLPEIFAQILSYLIYKPKYAINFSRISTKCYANIHNILVWKQLGFNNVMVNGGRIDNSVLKVMLQKIDYDRLQAKLIKTHVKISNLERRRDQKREDQDEDDQEGEETNQFELMCDALNKRYGLKRSLAAPFYEQVLTNRLLNDSVLQAIADRTRAQAPWESSEYLPELFRAFHYVLGSSKSDLEREGKCSMSITILTKIQAESQAKKVRTKMPRNYKYIDNKGKVYPVLTKVQPDDDQMTALQAQLYADSFIVCSFATKDTDYNEKHRGSSCFFKYCCGDTKAVIFLMKIEISAAGDEEGCTRDYYKVNLATKSIESSGSIRDLINEKQYPPGPNNYTQLTRALVDLFEMSVSEEEAQQISVQDWLQNYDVTRQMVDNLEDRPLVNCQQDDEFESSDQSNDDDSEQDD